MEISLDKTKEVAKKQLDNTFELLDILLVLNEPEFYSNDHYRSQINKARDDIEQLVRFTEG